MRAMSRPKHNPCNQHSSSVADGMKPVSISTSDEGAINFIEGFGRRTSSHQTWWASGRVRDISCLYPMWAPSLHLRKSQRRKWAQRGVLYMMAWLSGIKQDRRWGWVVLLSFVAVTGNQFTARDVQGGISAEQVATRRGGKNSTQPCIVWIRSRSRHKLKRAGSLYCTCR